MSELFQLKDLVDNMTSLKAYGGTLMVKHGLLVIKSYSGGYTTVSIEDGMLCAGETHDSHSLKQVAMNLNPEDYPLGETIYGD